MEIYRKSLYLLHIQENRDQKKTPYLDTFCTVQHFATEIDQFYDVTKNNSQSDSAIDTLNPFPVNILFLHPLKT